MAAGRCHWFFEREGLYWLQVFQALERRLLLVVWDFDFRLAARATIRLATTVVSFISATISVSLLGRVRVVISLK